MCYSAAMRRPIALAAGALTLAAVALCFVPLFDVLGYEFALALGVVAAVTAPLLGLALGRATPSGPAGLARALCASSLVLLPALVVIGLNALRVQNCNPRLGLAFFVLMPAPTALYGATLGVLVARLFPGAGRAARGVAIALVIVGPLAATLWTLYTQPPIFAFDHLWGWFAGALYDEVVTPDARLVVFRVGTVGRILLAAWLLRLADRGVRKATLVAAAVAALAVAAAFELEVGPRVGFRVTRAELRKVLPDTVERDGVVVHLPPGLEPERRQAIADDHAFRLGQLREKLGVTELPVVHSYVYSSAAEKARLMGGRDVMMAKPWLFEIHVHNPVAPHPVVAHELAHVVAASFAPPPLRVTSRKGVLVDMGLVEGLAEAVTPPRGDFDLDTFARALRALGLAPDMRRILGGAGFWTSAPGRAYTVAGSFVRWLLHTRGPAPLRAAYAHSDFEAAYGEPLDTLVSAWERWIDALPLSPTERAVAQDHFRTPSIFARVCAHEISTLRDEAQRSPPPRALDLYRRIAVFLGESPAARFDVALALDRAGHAREFTETARALLTEGELTPGQRGRLLEASGNVAWAAGDAATARARFEEVRALDLGAASTRLQWVRLWALGLPPGASATLRDFLTQKLPTVAGTLAVAELREVVPGDKTVPYLVARQLQLAGACALALPWLERAGPHPFAPIEAERLRLWAQCQTDKGDLAAAEAGWLRYADVAPSSGEAARARDAAERAAWRMR